VAPEVARGVDAEPFQPQPEPEASSAIETPPQPQAEPEPEAPPATPPETPIPTLEAGATDTPEPARTAAAFYELGMTFGTPAAANFVAGYWSAPSSGLSWLARVEGAYWGSPAGIQGELGLRLNHDRALGFNHFVALALDAARLDNANVYGVGPVYGFHAFVLTLESGFILGHYDNGGVTGSPIQFMVQVGVTGLW
jgi:hypothetical protein